MTIVIEKDVRFSQSLIWELQEAVYAQYGPEAWAIDNGVPSYITSNPFTAKQYAHVVIGYICDHLKTLSLQEPFYLFDLGAGSGRFSYLFLKELLSQLSEAKLDQIPICYVMTDFIEKNIAFWQSHPLLQPYIERGQVDFALYRHDENQPLYLRLKQQTLTSIKNPFVLIANYYFDTIPQDLFRVQNGQLFAGLCTLTLSEQQANKPQFEWINDLELSYRYEPVKNEELIPLLDSFSKKVKTGIFTYPTGAFSTLEYFEKLSNGQYLLLAGDQGIAQMRQIPSSNEPKFCRHTSFSIDVCYPLMAEYFHQKNYCAWIPQLSDPIFVNFTAVYGNSKEECYHTHLAWHYYINDFEPCDYWKLIIESHEREQSLQFILSLVKMGNWDPMPVHFFFNKIREEVKTVSENTKQIIIATIEKLTTNFYWIIPTDGDFITNLGVLLFDLKEYKKAIQYFQLAQQISGETKIILTNLGACYQAMLDLKMAHHYFQKIKEKDV